MTVMWFRPDVRCPPTSRALGAAEALVDPVQGLHPVGRVDALGREHPHAREHVLIPLRVELDRPVERVLDGLVTAADRHRDAPAGRVELQILEGPNHVVRARPPSGRLDRLFVRGLHALKGLHHVVAPVGRPARLAELLRATLDELPLERVPGGVGHLGPVRSPEAHDEAVGQVPSMPVCAAVRTTYLYLASSKTRVVPQSKRTVRSRSSSATAGTATQLALEM